MEARAIQRHIGVPATKVRQLIDLIRGKPVGEALTVLQFSPRPVARIIEKTLRSAIANAVNRDDERTVDADDLFVARAVADEGRVLKRIRPRARGAANRINKRQSHVTIVVSDGVVEAAPVAAAEAEAEGETAA